MLRIFFSFCRKTVKITYASKIETQLKHTLWTWCWVHQKRFRSNSVTRFLLSANMTFQINGPVYWMKWYENSVLVRSKHTLLLEKNISESCQHSSFTGDFNVINGVLRTGHSLFKKYRYEFKSQQLWTEIKFVLDSFSKPLTDLFVVCILSVILIGISEILIKREEIIYAVKCFQATMQLTETQTSPEVLSIVFNSLLMISKIFYSLNYQVWNEVQVTQVRNYFGLW